MSQALPIESLLDCRIAILEHQLELLKRARIGYRQA
ncbi:hypothetical protein J2X48_004714 [Bosea sp. BE271]|jgi:hypothetical protein|nr:hypothetical protein [Bosea robiniae]MDR6897275.1 hypothetical protein [Bosea sp. BE109]MDR7140672.1 hypothetical protein [Bosea sp. BE168]MDR7177765.1 hypothetical protein [Bosea sp. BE271]